MKPLRELQAAFQDHILTRDPAIQARVAGTGSVDVDTRLGIYSSAYRLRLLEALSTDYPGLKALTGEDEFDRMGRGFIEARPSAYRSLRWFGGGLADYLRATPPWSGQPACAEMAAFEWAMSDAFDAADSPLATIGQMAAIPPEQWPQLQFVAHASVRRLNLISNVPALWQTLTSGEAATPALCPQPVGWLVWRQGLDTCFRSLEVDEAWALDAMLRGEDFAAVCEGLCEWIDAQHVAAHAAGLLKQWLTDGLISAIRTP